MNKIGEQIIRLDSVDSTNNYTANQVRNGSLPHGAVILAVEQVAGRGQGSSTWQSNAGENLTFSVFLDEVNLSVSQQFDLSCLCALSIKAALEQYGIQSSVKWPNDVLVNDQKIAGILIELQVSGTRVRSAIVGIGLNVNQSEFDSLRATSMNIELGHRLPLDEVLFSFIHQFNRLVESSFHNSLGLREQYHQALFGLNEKRLFRDRTGEFEGIIRGTDTRGCLLVERDSEKAIYDLKELAFIY